MESKDRLEGYNKEEKCCYVSDLWKGSDDRVNLNPQTFNLINTPQWSQQPYRPYSPLLAPKPCQEQESIQHNQEIQFVPPVFYVGASPEDEAHCDDFHEALEDEEHGDDVVDDLFDHVEGGGWFLTGFSGGVVVGSDVYGIDQDAQGQEVLEHAPLN